MADIAPALLEDLRHRRKNTRWCYQVEVARWGTGTDLDYLKELVGYWQYNYDWLTQEAALNRLSRYRAL